MTKLLVSTLIAMGLVSTQGLKLKLKGPTNPKEEPASLWDFSLLTDPNHPGGHRLVEIKNDNQIVVEGSDKPGGPEFSLTGTINEDRTEIHVDFSAKGGPKNAKGTVVKEGIKFPDGNVWKFVHPDRLAGGYNDPTHPGCLRSVRMEGSAVVVLTTADQHDGQANCRNGNHEKPVELRGHLDGKEVHINDLVGKIEWHPTEQQGEPRGMPTRITWSDGNVWEKLNTAPMVAGTFIYEKYSDCFRYVTIEQTEFRHEISPVTAMMEMPMEGTTSCDRGRAGELQMLDADGALDGVNLTLDFSGSGGKVLTGEVSETRIKWADGTIWKKVGDEDAPHL